MSKEILVLSTSPRKAGNSDLLCDQFMLGAKETGNNVEKIFINDIEINYCKACDTCQNNGGVCAQDDDMAQILDKMIAADVIVLATPVYFYTMNGQLKTLIDRTFARYTSLSNKEFYFITTAAVQNKKALERTIEGLRGFTSVLSGADDKDIIYGTGVWKAGDVKGTEFMDQAYKMGKKV
jgi:multimeric flavodoxin WrbA